MQQTDIAIIGGGLAGSTAAAMLGRAGISAVLIDPHKVYPPDFRCEKLDASQVELLRKTGLADPVFAVATLDDEISIARFGRLVERRAAHQYGILYDSLVNTMRAQIPQSVITLEAKATALSTGADRQIVTLSDGESISARLVILANGLNIGLRHTVGMTREVISECHSITIGFDVQPVGKAHFDFRALTYFPERASDRMAYLSLFPIGATTRANLFVYRDMRDPWLREMRKTPEQALLALMPGLRRLTGDFAVSGDVKIRPADLYVTKGYRQPGIVLIGDAFATSCPAAGTGTNKVFNDVERLCNAHIPHWLASDGMSEAKIAAFYDDATKTACDAYSADKAFYLRALSVETGLVWRARRWARFLARLGMGAWQRMLAPRRLGSQEMAAGTR
ncbi:MAG TPA: NAD(P)/FAD-dependent oxidoreductase [Xanthobacteraceae bacterium]|nr:NAD(P)/FAD-dependent oxidoreductase [Xanthobacteraceae bacterium]